MIKLLLSFVLIFSSFSVLADSSSVYAAEWEQLGKIYTAIKESESIGSLECKTSGDGTFSERNEKEFNGYYFKIYDYMKKYTSRDFDRYSQELIVNKNGQPVVTFEKIGEDGKDENEGYKSRNRQFLEITTNADHTIVLKMEFTEYTREVVGTKNVGTLIEPKYEDQYEKSNYKILCE